MTIIKINYEQMKNVGCNNGNYPETEIIMNNGKKYIGQTCRCGNGCSGTWRDPMVGQYFKNEEDLFKFLES